MCSLKTGCEHNFLLRVDTLLKKHNLKMDIVGRKADFDISQFIPIGSKQGICFSHEKAKGALGWNNYESFVENVTPLTSSIDRISLADEIQLKDLAKKLHLKDISANTPHEDAVKMILDNITTIIVSSGSNWIEYIRKTMGYEFGFLAAVGKYGVATNIHSDGEKEPEEGSISEATHGMTATITTRNLPLVEKFTSYNFVQVFCDIVNFFILFFEEQAKNKPKDDTNAQPSSNSITKESAYECSAAYLAQFTEMCKIMPPEKALVFPYLRFAEIKKLKETEAGSGFLSGAPFTEKGNIKTRVYMIQRLRKEDKKNTPIGKKETVQPVIDPTILNAEDYFGCFDFNGVATIDDLKTATLRKFVRSSVCNKTKYQLPQMPAIFFGSMNGKQMLVPVRFLQDIHKETPNLAFMMKIVVSLPTSGTGYLIFKYGTIISQFQIEREGDNDNTTDLLNCLYNPDLPAITNSTEQKVDKNSHAITELGEIGEIEHHALSGEEDNNEMFDRIDQIVEDENSKKDQKSTPKHERRKSKIQSDDESDNDNDHDSDVGTKQAKKTKRKQPSKRSKREADASLLLNSD